MLNFPVVGLAPVDGVTDVVFRRIVDETSSPDILYTEFIPVDGLLSENPALYRMFLRHPTKTPIFAQLLGSNPHSFYKTTIIALELGFDGIDINMGCPDKNVFKKQAGAALILDAVLAQKIILSVKEAVRDWSMGILYTDLSLPKSILEIIGKIKLTQNHPERKKVPVSVKTRTGYQKPNIKQWISKLLETEPDIITVHGRTFTQGYLGKADWKEIEKAAVLAKNSKTKIFGNGDIKNLQEAKNAIGRHGVSGVLIARTAFGNPWIFGNHNPAADEKLHMILYHAKLFDWYFPNGNFKTLRKHFAWYAKSLRNSTALKTQLMATKKIQDVKKILMSYSLLNNLEFNR
jgi:nifR3 family TIM-barrel protein